MSADTFLTRISITREGFIQLRLKDQYSLHRIVYDLFEDIRTEDEKNASVAANIVWKDAGINENNRIILVVTNRRPKAHPYHGVMVVDTKLIPDSFLNHDLYRFDLLVNPVTRGGDRGRKIIPVKGRDNVRSWLLSKAEHDWGFQINPHTLDIGNTDVLQFVGKNAQKITLGQTKVSGTLSVTDRDKFKDSFCKGVGRGKAFGSGMLQAMPIIETIY